MRERFGLPVAIENDANAAAFAEWRFGAGQGATSMVMLTLGTGVGGGVVYGGQLMRGLAPSSGTSSSSTTVAPARAPAPDAAISRRTCPERPRRPLRGRPSGPAADAYRLVRLGNEGDARAIEILREIGGRLGSGIGTLVNVFDPELVVIGGGFACRGRPDPRAGARDRPAGGARPREGARPGRPGQARHGGRDRRRRARGARSGRRSGALAVCATPIGNLEDVTLRVLRELREADLVLCEDTRRTRGLLARHGIEARLLSYHEHNEAARTAEVLPRIVTASASPSFPTPGCRRSATRARG